MKQKYFLGLLLFNLSCAFAQYGIIDLSLNPGSGADNTIQTLALQADSKIIAGGDFLSFDGTAKKRLVRLNEDGSIDPTFSIGTGFNKLVTSVIVQPDQKIIVTGEFTAYNNTSKKRIVRLNPDGSADNTFNTGYGANGEIYSAYLQDDGKIVIGGVFTAVNWIAKSGIARLNADGSVDSSFHFDGQIQGVTDIKRLPDGKFIVNAVNKIYKLNSDGTIDSSFYTGAGTDHPIQSVLIQSNGKIILGGYFTEYDGITFQRILRLEADGNIDTSFFTSSGANYGVLGISEQPDGNLLITGLFSTFNGYPREKVARLTPDGIIDLTLDPQLGPNNVVLFHALQPDGRVVIAGDFSDYNGVSRNRIARIQAFNALSTVSASRDRAAFYPNPAEHNLTFHFPDAHVSSLTLADLTGKVVMESLGHTADVSALPKGLYLATAQTDQGPVTAKVIKN